MAKRLLLLTEEIGDDAMGLIDALKPRGYEADPYCYLADAARDLVRNTPVVLVLAESDRGGFIAKSVADLQLAIPSVRIINVVLPERTPQIAGGTLVRMSDLSATEIKKVVAAIESNLTRIPAPGREPASIAVAWDPAAVEPDEYAAVVAAISDLSRAVGGGGIERITGTRLLLSVKVEAGR